MGKKYNLEMNKKKKLSKPTLKIWKENFSDRENNKNRSATKDTPGGSSYRARSAAEKKNSREA